jgi:hypothetical protein
METVTDDNVLSLEIFERESKARFCLAWVHAFLDLKLHGFVWPIEEKLFNFR